ncbi:MAG: hypothetical protein WCE49_00080 [Terrimicrobiaceae bacterium]
MNDGKSGVRLLRLRVPMIATLLVGLLIGARGALERKPPKEAPVSEPSHGRSLLPFTPVEVVNYFSSVLGQQPARAPGEAFVFQDSKAIKPDHRYRVVIIKEHNDLVITFTVYGETGMNLARAFFDAPLFKADETQRFHAMLDHAKSGPSERLRRFTLTMKMLAYPQNTRLTVRLSP